MPTIFATNGARDLLLPTTRELSRPGGSRSDPPGFDEMLAPVGRIEAIDTYSAAGRRRMDEAPVTEIDAYVRVFLAFLVEEQQVAAAQAARC